MRTRELLVAPHRFAVGYHRQTFWNWLIGTAFFLGGVGGGLFLVSLLTGHAPGMLAGVLIVMVGKNGAHLAFLGRPERFLRAAARPDRSWIARGTWATGVFALTGFLSVLLHSHSPFIQLPDWATTLNYALASSSALFIACYDGFLMRSSAGVAFWRTLLLPLLLFMYATLGGITVSLTLHELRGEAPPEILPRLEHGLLVANFFLLAIYLLRMSRALPAARETLRQWLSGRFARLFFGLVVLVGLGATLLLSLLHNGVHGSWLVLLIAACELIGDFSMMMLLLKSGLFAPQTAQAYSRATVC